MASLVGAAEAPHGFAPVCAAHALRDDGVVLAHRDGTVSVFQKHSLSRLWLHPGRSVQCVAAYDDQVLVAFADRTCSLYSLNSGLQTAVSPVLPLVVEKVALFEHFVVAWSSTQLEVVLLDRSLLEIVSILSANSFVINVFSLGNRLSVVCAAHLYWLIPIPNNRRGEYTLQLLKDGLDFPIMLCFPLARQWLFVGPEMWSLCSLNEKTQRLETELETRAPAGLNFHGAHPLSDGVAIECSDHRLVLLRGNNIQMLELPFTPHAHPLFYAGQSVFISSKLDTQRLVMSGAEFTWEEYTLPVQLENRRFLIGQTDEQISATHKKVVGLADGSVKDPELGNSLLFPNAVLEIDSDYIYSATARVRRPLQAVNVMEQLDQPITDKRVSVQLREHIKGDEADGMASGMAFFGGMAFVGAFSNSAFLQPVPSSLKELHHGAADLPPTAKKLHPSLALALATAPGFDVERLFNAISLAPPDIAVLENMAVSARLFGPPKLLTDVVRVLARAWPPERVDSLLRTDSAHALRVLAAFYSADINAQDVGRAAFEAYVRRQVGTASPEIADAVIGAYELGLLGTPSLPLQSLAIVPLSRVERFARYMLQFPDRLVKGVAQALNGTGAAAAGVAGAAGTRRNEEAGSAARLLLAAVHTDHRWSQRELRAIVTSVMPAVKAGVPHAKPVLSRLLATRAVLYNRPRQRLLVPTPRDPRFDAYVFSMADEADRFRLVAANALELNFSADGNAVFGVRRGTPVTWPLSRGIQGLFGKKATLDVQPTDGFH